MTILMLLLAAFSGAFFHFALRKGIDQGGRASVFQLVQCFFAFLVVTLMNVRLDTVTQIDLSTLNVGCCEGVLYLGMMLMLSIAFQKGPSGLTVATMNSASVVPAILMAVIFGASFGHGYTLFNGVGSLLVVGGLFLAARTSVLTGELKKWTLAVFLAFAGHSLYLSVFQWRALKLRFDEPLPHFNLTMNAETAHWFQSLIFLTAFVILAVHYLIKDRRKIERREIFWGALGGLGNAFCTFGLVYASEIATGTEKAMIFPIAGVVSILLCNLWGKWLYKENVNWKALGLCLGGLVIGTVDWANL